MVHTDRSASELVTSILKALEERMLDDLRVGDRVVVSYTDETVTGYTDETVTGTIRRREGDHLQIQRDDGVRGSGENGDWKSDLSLLGSRVRKLQSVWALI